ncbi:MAG: copper-binding protein [Allosphingosinicella sp.]|uniref:copper-binding protein n=1 Tax=Allosphingosinicella sp. TaxID=2823234 RepID=UPI00393DF34B
MHRLLPIVAALLLASPAAALAPDWRQAIAHDVLLAPWRYEPRTIRLEAGQPIRLTLVNNSEVAQHFAARDFFAAARIREEDEAIVRNGNVRLGPGERRTIALVPAPGRYRVRSANLFHRLLGMSGLIVVE